MAEPKTPVDSHAIALVQGLAVAAVAPTILSITTSGLGAGLPANIPVAFDRSTQAFKSLKPLIEEFRTGPEVRKGTAVAETLASFIALVDRHKDDDSAIFGNTSWPNPKLTAVLDYDRHGGASRFGKHRVEYSFPLTDEFRAWVKGDAQPMEQEAFAAFIEEHAAELSAPMDGERSTYEPLFKEVFATPSEVLALSRHLEVHVNAKAKQGIRLQTGERVVEFTTDHVDSKGDAIAIPGIFIVSVPAFVDGEAVRIPARLRYRIAGGSIKWFYQLYRWQFYLREQVQRDLREAGEKTGLPVFEGAAEK